MDRLRPKCGVCGGPLYANKETLGWDCPQKCRVHKKPSAKTAATIAGLMAFVGLDLMEGS